MKLDGKKTYIGAALGLVAALLPVVGVPVAVSTGVGAVASLLVLYGRKKAADKSVKAFAEGYEVGRLVVPK